MTCLAKLAHIFAGARLTPLAKKDGGVRPVACGEVLRRVASKCACRRLRSWGLRFFPANAQFGVGCPGGAEAVVHAARAVVSGW